MILCQTPKIAVVAVIFVRYWHVVFVVFARILHDFAVPLDTNIHGVTKRDVSGRGVIHKIVGYAVGNVALVKVVKAILVFVFLVG